MFVHVWPDRFPRAWDGKDDLDKFDFHPVVPYTEAFTATYNTDAHFCPAVVQNAQAHPRLTVKLKPEYVEDVRFHVLVLDIDGPEHTCPDDWYQDQISRLRGTPWEGSILYRTKGGYRLVWELPEALRAHEYLNLLAALRAIMKGLGIVADELKDWSRCYRLPFVKRDGKKQELELRLPENPMFPLSLVTFSREKEPRQDASLGQDIAASKLPLTKDDISNIGQGGRNNTLFRMLSSLRNLAWVDEDLALSLAITMNQERCDPPLDEADVTALVRNVWGRYDPGEIELPSEAEIQKAHIVLTNGYLDTLVQECISALSKHPNVYARQGGLVRVSEGQIQEIPRNALRTTLSEVADFYKLKKNDAGSFDEVNADVPKDLAMCVAEHGLYPGIRELEQIYTLPALRPDGVLLSSPGYDEVTKSLLIPEFIVEVPDDVNFKDAMEAKERIKALYTDFPFKEKYHLASAMAALMTPVLRLTIKGPTPLFLFESPVPSSGKTKSATLVALVATGERPAVMAPTNEEETTKQITSQLLAGARIIFIDNVEKPLGGPSLDAALTSEWWSARRLGVNDMLRLRNTATWMATGNNVQLAGDIARRTIRILIDPGMEHPEERDPNSFKFPRIEQHVLDNRADIVRDILIMAKARMQADFSVSKNMGSFESWSYWVRETLMWLGEGDCLDSQAALKTSASVGTFGNFLTCALAVFQPKGERKFAESAAFTAKEMHDVLFSGARRAGSVDQTNGLIAAYQELTDDFTLRNCARLLHRWSNRVIAGHRLIVLDRDPVRGVQFQVTKVGGTTNGHVEEAVSGTVRKAAAGS